MSGKRVTDRQVRRYMDSHKDGHPQAAAAARARRQALRYAMQKYGAFREVQLEPHARPERS
jgi:hypothetical protein